MDTSRTSPENAQPKSKKAVLILITNSFAAINLVHSGLLNRLCMAYDIHLISTMIGAAEIRDINVCYNINVRLVDLSIPSEPAWLALLRRIEKALFARHFNIVTQRIKYRSGGKWEYLFVRILMNVLTMLGLNRLTLRTLRRTIIFATSYSNKLKLLLSYRFDGVISSSPLDLRENHIVNFLRKHDVKSLAMVISWDNLTSKGVINADHDYTLVWNNYMEREFLRFYSIFDIKQPKVRITGIPRFDKYFEETNGSGLTEAGKPHSVSNGKRVILLATSAGPHFPNQLEVIQDVIQFAEIHGNVHVIIRCHPADKMNGYEALAQRDFITLWHPKNLPKGNKNLFYEWFPELDFLNSLSEMLRRCDVCIQFASTMKLDAAACGKHVISIGYDGRNPLPYHQSVRRLYDYAHQLPLNDLQLDQRVISKAQLFEALKTTLEVKKSESRLSMIEPFIHFAEAKSVEVTAKTIAEWLH